jgi:hypothetical protein
MTTTAPGATGGLSASALSRAKTGRSRLTGHRMPTTYLACPTEIVEAPIDVVWKLLTNISGWGDFFDVRALRVEPPGPAIKGQRMIGESGPRWLHLRVSFEYTLIDEPHHELELDVQMPLGITVHEALDCVPIDDERCRVNYHCHFGFPNGWRGALTRLLLRRELREGPADSLSRLKRAAEQEYRGRKAEKREP